MKWYYWVAITIGIYVVFIHKAVTAAVNSATTNTLATADPTAGAKITTIAVSQQMGASGVDVDTIPADYLPVDPNSSLYPGYDHWYRSKITGDWYDLDTGDFYSGDSSPPHYNATPTTVVLDLTPVTPIPNDPGNPDAASNYVIY